MREFDLLQHVYRANADLGERIAIPPGDDLALLRLNGRELLVGVDQLVAGRHVRLETTPLKLVGRKAVVRSLSDIAAMAGRPVASIVAAVLPPDFGGDRATELFEAMRAAAAEFDAPLIGGDIAFHADSSHPLTCSLTVLAEPTERGVVTRGGARTGDAVYVTGSLGGSLAPDGSGRHLTFTPRIAEAIQLHAAIGDRLHAMIDLSDGLGRDASHIAEQSGVSIEIDAERIPASAGIDWKSAASDGEDYELLFTAAGNAPATLDGNVPVTRIGRVAPREDPNAPLVIFNAGGERIPGDQLGWQHEA
jgi:thiamine-monophosphate kinase